MPFSFMTTSTDRRKNGASGTSQPRRLPFILPYLAIALVLVGYGVFWLAAREILKARLAQEADQLRCAGYTVELAGLRIGGFPFRLRLHYDRLRLVGPSGWGVAAPGLDAQAFVYAPGHWVVVAPAGLEVERGGDGPVSIRGRALRASVVSGRAAPWRVALEGEAMTFSAPQTAQPFIFTRADRFDVLLRPAPDRSGGQLLMRLTGASVAPSSALAPITGSKPLTLDLALRLTKPEAFKGAAWASAVEAWSRAGGEAQIVRLQAAAGAANLSVVGGALHVGEDGRLAGSVPLHVALPSGLAVLPMIFGGHVSLPVRIVAVTAALVRGAGGALNAPLTFQNGRAELDGLAIGPAPSVYRPTVAGDEATPNGAASQQGLEPATILAQTPAHERDDRNNDNARPIQACPQGRHP
jgi:hypothetical protein